MSQYWRLLLEDTDKYSTSKYSGVGIIISLLLIHVEDCKLGCERLASFSRDIHVLAINDVKERMPLGFEFNRY